MLVDRRRRQLHAVRRDGHGRDRRAETTAYTAPHCQDSSPVISVIV